MMSLLIIAMVWISSMQSARNQQMDSPLPKVEYEVVQPLIYQESYNLCTGNLTESSALALKKLIFKEGKKLLYLNINLRRQVEIPTNYSSILEPMRWVWVENSAGRPLLELDFRFHTYSLTTLSLDVGEMTMDIQLDKKCLGLDSQSLAVLVSSTVKQTIRGENSLSSSVCHARLANYVSVSARYYIQYKCCDISNPGKYDFDKPSEQSCLVLKKNADGTFVNSVFFLLFLVTPLLIKVLHVRDEVYEVTITEAGITIKDPYATLENRKYSNNNKNKPKSDTRIEEYEMMGIPRREQTLNNSEHNDNLCNVLQERSNKITEDNDNGSPSKSDSARGSSRDTLSLPCSSDSLSVNKRRSVKSSELDEIILTAVLAQMTKENSTAMDIVPRNSCSSILSNHEPRISMRSDSSGDMDSGKDVVVQLAVPDNDEQGVGSAFLGYPEHINNSRKVGNMSLDNPSHQIEHIYENMRVRKKNSIVEVDSHGGIARIIFGESNSIFNSNPDESNINASSERNQNNAANENTAEIGKGTMYIVLDSSTPLRISQPIKHIFLLQKRGDWLCRIRRFCFFIVLYPCIMYAMITMDICLYANQVRHLYNVEREMGINGKITDLEIFDHFWLGTFFTYPALSVASLYLSMYILMTFILSMRGNLETVLSTLTENNEYLGCIKLPPSLCRSCDTNHGFLLLYQKMQYRFSLIWEPQFWTYWFKELVFTVTKPCCKQPSHKCFFHRPFKMAACILCLLWLFPLFNCIPCDNIMQAIMEKRKAGELQSLLRRKYRTRNYGKVALILVSVLIVTLGLIFALLIFLKSCKVVTMFVLYTIKGIVKHYMNTLPVVSILVISVYYFLGTIHRLDEKYKAMKKIVFDECILLQSEIDKGRCIVNVVSPLVVYKKDGVPMIPKALYKKIIDKHMPLRENEFYALLKIFLIAIFLVYVALTVDAFKIANVTTLGQTIGTFFAATLPKLLEFFYSRDPIKNDCLKFKFRETIKQYCSIDLMERPSSNQTDDPTSSELPCADLAAHMTCTVAHKETSV